MNNIGSNERFVRWQTALRDYVTFFNNLLLTLGLGILGFIFSSLNDSKFELKCLQKFFFTSSLIILIISMAIGIFACLSRISDFRTTLKKINKELNSEDFQREKNLMDIYGKTTWCLFYIQIYTFLISIIFLTTSLIILYNEKLF